MGNNGPKPSVYIFSLKFCSLVCYIRMRLSSVGSVNFKYYKHPQMRGDTGNSLSLRNSDKEKKKRHFGKCFPEVIYIICTFFALLTF